MKDIDKLYEEVQKASIEYVERKKILDREMARKCVDESYGLFCEKIRWAGFKYGCFRVKIPSSEWRANYCAIKDEYILEVLLEDFGIFNPVIEDGAIIFSWEVKDVKINEIQKLESAVNNLKQATDELECAVEKTKKDSSRNYILFLSPIIGFALVIILLKIFGYINSQKYERQNQYIYEAISNDVYNSKNITNLIFIRYLYW